FWHHAFGTPAPDTTTGPQRGRSLGLLPCQRQRARYAPLPVVAPAMHRYGRCNAPIGEACRATPKPAMTAGESWLPLQGYPSITLMTDEAPFRARPTPKPRRSWN
ncbi:MAG: hypothetical protein OJI67_10455, partial [Prosthecobacter sp.]|nr:hypothetical protein [Prosthecobacter sp.]